MSTVPAEAESYCARDAISTGGIVLTGDSDLLLFAAEQPHTNGWGVIMFRDVTLTFPGAVCVVFRPCAVAGTLGVDLAFLGYLLQADPHATFPVLQQRVKRIEERKRSGVAVGEYGKGWREFRAVYELPGAGEEEEVGGGGGAGVEPRIAELLDSRGRAEEGEARRMWLPFLWEDPGRGSAWDAGRAVRAGAYGLVFKEGVMEVCRRGQRISEAFVHSVDAAGVLERVAGGGDGGHGGWWVRAIVENVVGVYEDRGQTPPERSLLEGLAYMLAASSTAAAGWSGPPRWTWEKVQVFAMAQAAWYSLLLLKEVLAATGKDGCNERFEIFPGVAECIDGRRFLEGVTLAGENEKRLVRVVMAAYYARIRNAHDGQDIDTQGNGNGKRSSSRELGAGASSEKKKKKKKKRGKDKNLGESSNAVEAGNIFEVLAD